MKPDKLYTFSFVQQGNVQHNYLETFHPWLVWSDAEQGAYCYYCLLLAATDGVGKGDHQPPEILVLRPLQKVKDIFADCRAQTKHNYHKASIAYAEGFTRHLKETLNVITQVDASWKKQAAENHR